MKRIFAVRDGDREVRVYRDVQWKEYRARLYIEGKLYAPADYHTDDREDAIDTSKHMVRRPEAH